MNKWIAAAAQMCPPAKRTAVRVRESIQQKQYKRQFADVYSVNPKMVLFLSYSGKQYACSPKALYEQMCRDEKYNDFMFIWAFKEPEKYAWLRSGRTVVVKYGSKDFRQFLASAKYWITNSRIPGYAQKKPEQVYIQTWHGTPFKRLGFDVEHYITGADDAKSMQRSYVTDAARYDYMLSPSPYYSEKMRSAFHLDAIGQSDIMLEMGYPRNDALYLATEEDVAKIREKLGVTDKKVILYAPTWREEGLNPKEGFTYGNGLKFMLGLDLKALKEKLGEEYVILLRCHYYISRLIAKEDNSGFVIDVSDYPEINDLYLASDLLITDYSSVFFDYAITKKPMLFYMYDLENYRKVRDFYFDVEELPGAVVEREEDLYDAIVQSMQTPCYNEKYKAFLEKFNPYEGACSARVLETVIR